MIRINNVWFSYNGNTVLSDINLNVKHREFLAIIGPNGGGKTTLLKLILGLLKPNAGTIEVYGSRPEKASHKIGYVPQDININQSFPITALDVVLMGLFNPAKRWKKNSSADIDKAMVSLKKMGIESVAHKKVGDLSGGQRQRVFIARAFVTDPELLLLDEPTASIDSKGQADFYSLLKALNEEVTILVVSHDLLAISQYVQSIACVNKILHYHDHSQITGEILEEMYPCSVEDDACPVPIVSKLAPIISK